MTDTTPADDLPPLPEPQSYADYGQMVSSDDPNAVACYGADELQAYAIAAIAAHDAKPLALLREVLESQEAYAKANHSLDVARKNFTSWAPEERAMVAALARVSNAEKAARAYIEREGA